MQQLLVELSEMARQISAQLDTRATKLELLIKEADEKLAALESAASASEFRPVAVRPPRLALLDSHHDPDTREESANGSPHPGFGASERSPRCEEPNISALPDPRHAEIYALADEGRAAGEIAQRLGRPSG